MVVIDKENDYHETQQHGILESHNGISFETTISISRTVYMVFTASFILGNEKSCFGNTGLPP
jgi:hypothetical protein